MRTMDFWTACGWLFFTDGLPVPCEEAMEWYAEEREFREWVDLGGES